MEKHENSDIFYENTGYREKWGQIEGEEILPEGNRKITTTAPKALYRKAIQISELMGMSNSEMVREGLRLFVAKYYDLHQNWIEEIAEETGATPKEVRRKLMGRRKRETRKIEEPLRDRETEEDV